MQIKTFNPNYPIVLGLSGKALTGKTCTADVFVPAGIREVKAQIRTPFSWDHLFFALPLKRMAAARQRITGVMAYDRMCYEIHSTLLDVFGVNPLYGAPPYHQLLDMVDEIATFPISDDGEKPRTFLQFVGTELCRAYDDDCWVNWMGREINKIYAEYRADEEDDARPFAVAISDLRFTNEAKFVYDHPNGVAVRFSARDDVRQARALERDKKLLTDEQLNHRSELSVDEIPDEYVIDMDTSDLTVQDQVFDTYSILRTYLRGLPDATRPS